MQVTEIYIHPVKSMRGVAVDGAELTPSGLKGDRKFAVIQRKSARVLTARERPVMVGIIPSFDDAGQLTLSYQDQSVTVEGGFGETGGSYKIWDDHISAATTEGQVSEFLSDITGVDCYLAQSTTESKRHGALTVFPDTFVDLSPLLITTEQSLEDLNSHLDSPINHRHFRPNIVIGGLDQAYAEDKWDQFAIGDIAMEILMGCIRCSIPDVDVDRFKQNKAMPVAAALKKTRQGPDRRLYFGQNARALTSGFIQVGDPVSVKTRRDSQILHEASKQIYAK